MRVAGGSGEAEVAASLPGSGGGGLSTRWGAQMGGRDRSCGFSFGGGKNGGGNTRERKGWRNKDLKLKCDAKKKEEMSGVGPGDAGRGWAGACGQPPRARRLPEGRGGMGFGVSGEGWRYPRRQRGRSSCIPSDTGSLWPWL